MEKEYYSLFWLSSDKQGSFPMGDYGSRAEAESAVPAALEEMLAVGASDDHEWIEAGTWVIAAKLYECTAPIIS